MQNTIITVSALRNGEVVEASHNYSIIPENEADIRALAMHFGDSKERVNSDLFIRNAIVFYIEYHCGLRNQLRQKLL